MKDVVYFELNNWFGGRDYPSEEPFYTWLGNDLKQSFTNEEFVKENKLVVVCGSIDMSMNYCITAPRKWVEENCPVLLSDNTYTYDIIRREKTVTYTKKYSDFLKFYDEEYGLPEGRCGMPFKEYCEENIGVHWYDYQDFQDL
jgi:hypothetical protein